MSAKIILTCLLLVAAVCLASAHHHRSRLVYSDGYGNRYSQVYGNQRYNYVYPGYTQGYGYGLTNGYISNYGFY